MIDAHSAVRARGACAEYRCTRELWARTGHAEGARAGIAACSKENGLWDNPELLELNGADGLKTLGFGLDDDAGFEAVNAMSGCQLFLKGGCFTSRYSAPT